MGGVYGYLFLDLGKTKKSSFADFFQVNFNRIIRYTDVYLNMFPTGLLTS